MPALPVCMGMTMPQAKKPRRSSLIRCARSTKLIVARVASAMRWTEKDVIDAMVSEKNAEDWAEILRQRIAPQPKE